MKHSLKNIVLAMTAATVVTACTSGPLQSTRMSKAEGYMTQAEQALATNSPNKMKVAESNIGTAKAYIHTVRDNIKHLSKAEKIRYNSLKAKADAIDSRIVR